MQEHLKHNQGTHNRKHDSQVEKIMKTTTKKTNFLITPSQKIQKSCHGLSFGAFSCNILNSLIIANFILQSYMFSLEGP